MSEHKLYPNITFEPGIHASPAERDALEKSIKIGNTNSFSWNPEVGQRLQETHPLIMAIDGVGLYYNVKKDQNGLRYSLPLRPVDT